MEIVVKGDVKPGFELVRHEFARLWDGIEVGASFCVFHGSEKVVDIWVGYADREMCREWLADTLLTVFSTTKGLTALPNRIVFVEVTIDD